MHQEHPPGAEAECAEGHRCTQPLDLQHLQDAKLVHLLLALLVSADTVADDWAGRRQREGGSIEEDSS